MGSPTKQKLAASLIEEPFLRPVRVRYVQPFKPLIGVFNRALDCRLVPQNVLGIEACRFGIGPVLSLLVPVYVPLFSLFTFVEGEIRGTFGPEMNRFAVVYDGFKFLVFSGGWSDYHLHM